MSSSSSRVTNADRSPVRSLVAVACGGALGTLCRVLILDHTDTSFGRVSTESSHVVTSVLHIPLGLLAINTFGVFAAAWLLSGRLRARSPNDPWRLFAITGLLGGLTSYSGLIRDAATVRSNSLADAILLVTIALLFGIAAAVLGTRVARR